MDFIYQLGGVVRHPEERLTIEFHSDEGDLEAVFSGMHVEAKLGLSAHDLRRRLRLSARRRRTAPLPKLTIPSPSMVHYRGGRASIDPAVYPELDAFWADLTAAYREEVRRLGELGCTYLQLDDTSLAYMNDPEQRKYVASIGGDPAHQHEEYIRHMNEALAGRPAGMAVTTHLCRGNFRSSWVASGSYDFVAEALFNDLEVDGYFLEWDDERSGGFEPLRFMPKGKVAVLGLVTTKRGELESKDELKRRIEEAATYVDVDQLCLSPQCGFASTVEGNELTVEQQAAKLRLVVEVADEVWGSLSTVRDATFDVFRRRGLTTMFANPGSTEVPFLTALPDDIRFVLGLHETAVVGLASGLAIGTRPARSRPPAHDGGARHGRQRPRDRPREPRAARGRRGAAGPSASRLRAVPRREAGGARRASIRSASTSRRCAQDVPAAIERAFHAAEAKRGPALVIVPMDDWEQPADEEREPAAAVGPVVRAAAAAPEAVDALVDLSRGGEVAGARRRCGSGRRGDLGGARGAGGAARGSGLPGVVRRPRRIPAGSPAVLWRAACRARAAARAARRRTTRSSSSARRLSARRRTCRDASPRRERGSRCSATTRTRCTGALRSWRVLASPAVVCRSSPAALPAARRRAAGAVAPAASALAARCRASLSLRATCSPRWPSGCRANAVVVEEAPVDRPEHPRAAACARASRLPQRSPRRPRLRDACGRRSAHGPAAPACRCRRRRRLGDLRRSRRLERGALRDRRALRRPLERALRRHGPARRAPRRHRSLARVRRGRAGDDRARLRLSRLGGSRRTTS